MSQSERVPRNGYAFYISLSRAGSEWLESLVRSFRRPLVKQGLVLGVENLNHRSEDLHTRWRWRGGEENLREGGLIDPFYTSRGYGNFPHLCKRGHWKEWGMNSADLNEVYLRLGAANKPLLDESRKHWDEEPVQELCSPARIGNPFFKGEKK